MRNRIPLFLAAHEAGHAVALIVLSPEPARPFSRIEVGFDLDDRPLGRVYVEGCAMPSAFDQAVIAMAGPVAEQRITHRGLRRSGDFDRASRLVGGVDQMYEVVAAARKLVRLHYPAVYWLARNLQSDTRRPRHLIECEEALTIFTSVMTESVFDDPQRPQNYRMVKSAAE